MSCISVQTKRNGGVSVAAVNKGGKFLRVTPESVQWITVEMPIDYNVESNVIWNIQ